MFLHISHEGIKFIGYLFLDDQGFCRSVYEFLRPCIGMSIKDIGDSQYRDFVLQTHDPRRNTKAHGRTRGALR